MEELRQVVRRLVISEEAMKGVVNCYSKNMENLKKFTLDLNERVNTIELTLKNNAASIDDVNKKSVERLKEDLINLDVKIDSVETKLVDGVNRTSEDIHEQEGQQQKLKTLIQENEKRMVEVESKLEYQKEKIQKLKTAFSCDECGTSFSKKCERRKHINEQHPKHFVCGFCDLIFRESWQYEMHLESHNKTKENKCEVCGKEFYLEWRYRQHVNTHTNPLVRKCHFFNNNKECPYEIVGCKFKHVKSTLCKHPRNCKAKLCPNQHIVD